MSGRYIWYQLMYSSMGCHDEGVFVALPRGYESFGFPFVAKTIMTTIRQ